MRPHSGSYSYLFRDPLGISTTTSTSTGTPSGGGNPHPPGGPPSNGRRLSVPRSSVAADRPTRWRQTVQRTYPPGVTAWIDAEVPDVAAAREFYAELFGWAFDEEQVARVDGGEVAGLRPSEGTARWTTSVAVTDAEAAAEALRRLGGQVLEEPGDEGPRGRTAVCADPQGALFRLWQPGARPGAQVANVPGAWNFSDLHTPDRAGAEAFYGQLFGWRVVDMAQDAGAMIQVPGYGDHLAATVDPGIHERQAAAPPGFADVIGGLVATPPGEPARWHVVFTVAVRDESTATAERLGATVPSRAEDVWTRTALVRDPQGA